MARLTSFALGGLALRAVASAASSPAYAQRRQSWPDPAQHLRSPEDCLHTSFSNPTWTIFDPALVVVNSSSGGTQGDVRWLTVNSATGLSANCTAKDIDLDPRGPGALDIWHNCSIPNLFFQFNLETLDMRLKGSWRCGDSSSLVFAANGSWEVPLIQGCLDEWDAPRGQETLCIMGNSQVPAGLSSPVSIHPQLPLLPYTPTERAQRCVDRAYDPEWEINSLIYRHHHLERGNATSTFYDLDLEITNISDGHSTNCSARVDLLHGGFRNGSTPWVRCTETGGSSNTSIPIEVSLDTDYGIFGLKQAWVCTDRVEGVERDQFNGIAYTNISLVCVNPLNLAIYGIDGSVVGASSNYNCSLPSTPVSFTGYLDPAPQMPHTYYTRSCTITSMMNTTALGLQAYQIEGSESGDGAAVVGSFTLFNPGSGDSYKIYRMPVISDGGWHNCTAGPRALPWQLVGCKYMLDRASHRLGFQVQWYCDDRDPTNAILFDATAVEQLPAEVCKTADGTTTCDLPVDVAELVIPVTSLSWKASGSPMDRGPTLPWL